MARNAKESKLYKGDIEDFEGYLKVPRIVLYFMLNGKAGQWQVSAFLDLVSLLTCKASTDKVTKKHTISLRKNERRLAFGMLAKRWGVSPGSVRYFIKQLIEQRFMTRKIVKLDNREHTVYLRTDMSHSTTTSTTQTLQLPTNQLDTKETSTPTSTLTSTNYYSNNNNIKKEILEGIEEVERTEEQNDIHLNICINKKNSFLEYIKSKKGAKRLDFLIIDTTVFRQKKYTKEDILIQFDKMFNSWIKSKLTDVRKRIHLNEVKKLDALATWMFSEWAKSSSELEQQTKLKSKGSKYTKKQNGSTNIYSSKSLLNITIQERFFRLDNLSLEHTNSGFIELVSLMNTTGKAAISKALERKKKEVIYETTIQKVKSDCKSFDIAYRKKYFYISESYLNTISK